MTGPRGRHRRAGSAATPGTSGASSPAKGEPHIALGAHLDTVAPTDRIEPFLGRRRGLSQPAPHHPGRRRQGRGGGPAPRHRAAQGVGDGRSRRTSCSSPCREEIGLVGSKHFDEKVLSEPLRRRVRFRRTGGGHHRQGAQPRHVQGHVPRPGRPRRRGAGARAAAPSRRPPRPSPPCTWAASTRRPAPTSA